MIIIDNNSVKNTIQRLFGLCDDVLDAYLDKKMPYEDAVKRFIYLSTEINKKEKVKRP